MATRSTRDAIVVDQVSKEFRLHKDRATSLKELITRRDRKSGADRFQALHDVSLTIPEGSMYALVGHNGSGKSTLLRCIAGIYQPTTGQVHSTGRISTLLELGAGFHPDLTGRENVYMNATILGMNKKEIDRAFDEIVEFAGIGEFIDSPVKIYSSGMYVRLGFSVAVHVHPEILIIDEVIAVGDTEFQRKCFDHLYSLRKQGTTIVVVTHGLGTVEAMCDGAAWLDHGRLQMTGRGGEVVAAYTDRVNAREREERERIAAEVAATSGGEGATDGAPAPARSIEDIEVESVELIGADGVSGDIGVYREPFTIRVHYVARRPVANPVFGIAIHTAAMFHVTGTNTKIDDAPLGTLDGRGHVDFAVDSLPLTPGDYELTVAISDEFIQHTYDRREREYHLRVRSGTDRQTPEGVIDMLGRWSATRSDRPAPSAETARP